VFAVRDHVRFVRRPTGPHAIQTYDRLRQSARDRNPTTASGYHPAVRSTRRRPLALAIGVVLAPLLAEAGFRIAGIRPPVPDESEVARATPADLNKLRYHDRDWKRKKPEGTWRTIALGDSFTAGMRVPLEDLFVKRVERSLNQRAGGRRRYEILNLAQPNWDTRDELEAFRRTGLPYQPDAVFVVFFVNDATGLDSNPLIVQRMHEEIYRREGRLNRLSRVYDWVDWQRRKRSVSRRTIESYRASFFDDEQQEQWRESREALIELRDLARERGLPLGVVIFPMLVRLHEGHELADVYQLVADTCEELGIPVLNLLPAFLGRDEHSLWVSATNAHPNSAGNALAAGPIEAFLIEAGLVPDPEAD